MNQAIRETVAASTTGTLRVTPLLSIGDGATAPTSWALAPKVANARRAMMQMVKAKLFL